MITFADLGPVPTVHLFMRVPVALPGGGWTWGEPATCKGVLARDFVYSAKECRSLVRTYGRTMSRINRRKELGERFTILAKGPVTGKLLGLKEWAWDAREREYTPCSEYLCGWREAVKAYWEATGEMIERKRFSPSIMASTLTLIPSPPHVRTKEDVPHEHALPDLYGVRSA